MNSLIELKLPDEVMESCPKDREGMLRYLTGHFDKAIKAYEERFRRRAGATLGEPLSRFERSLLIDFLLETLIGGPLRESLEASGSIAVSPVA